MRQHKIRESESNALYFQRCFEHPLVIEDIDTQVQCIWLS